MIYLQIYKYFFHKYLDPWKELQHNKYLRTIVPNVLHEEKAAHN